MRVIQILCQFQAYKGAGGANQLVKNLAYNQEKIYFSITADFFLTKSLLLLLFLDRKCETLTKLHNSLRLHQPV